MRPLLKTASVRIWVTYLADKLMYRVWTDQEAVSLIKDGPWLSDVEALVSELIKSSESQHATPNILSGAITGAALGTELNDLDE